MRYTVVLVPDEESGRYVAYVPLFPGCTTDGATVDEAIAMAHDAVTLTLESKVERGDDIPIEPANTLMSYIEVEAPVPAEAVA